MTLLPLHVPSAEKRTLVPVSIQNLKTIVTLSDEKKLVECELATTSVPVAMTPMLKMITITDPRESASLCFWSLRIDLITESCVSADFVLADGRHPSAPPCFSTGRATAATRYINRYINSDGEKTKPITPRCPSAACSKGNPEQRCPRSQQQKHESQQHGPRLNLDSVNDNDRSSP